MEYLLLAILSIIVYAEVLPTISMFFELIRTCFTSKIVKIQQNTIYIQKDIQDIQNSMRENKTPVIGFQTTNIETDEEDYE